LPQRWQRRTAAASQRWVDQLRKEQSLANERLVPFVDRRRLTDLRDGIEELVAVADRRAA